MKKFAFKFKPVYEYRLGLLDRSQAELGTAARRLASEVERLEALREAHSRTGAELDKLKRQGRQTSELNLYSSYLAGVKIHLTAQEALIAELRRRCEARREKLVEASRDKKAVEALKERSYGAWLKEADLAEQKDHDDLASTRFKGEKR